MGFFDEIVKELTDDERLQVDKEDGIIYIKITHTESCTSTNIAIHTLIDGETDYLLATVKYKLFLLRKQCMGIEGMREAKQNANKIINS